MYKIALGRLKSLNILKKFVFLFIIATITIFQVASDTQKGFVQCLPKKVDNKVSVSFSRPSGIAVDSCDNLYVIDEERSSVIVFSSEGKILRKWGIKGYKDGELFEPWDIKVDSNGFVYIADTGNRRIQQFTSDGVFVKKYKSCFGEPIAIDLDDSGNIYIADRYNKCVQRLTNDGSTDLIIENIGGCENNVYDVHVDVEGYIYITDGMNTVSKYSSSGELLKTITCELNNREAAFTRGIEIDMDGSIYVTDALGGYLQKYSAEGNFVWEFGGNGNGEYKFQMPQKVLLDSKQNIYVCDTNGNSIKKYSREGKFILDIGSSSNLTGSFDYPMGIAIDQYNNIYVADNTNGRIQKFNEKGSFIKAWGNNVKDNEQLRGPLAIAVSKSNEVYVVDDHCIIKYSSTGKYIRKWAEPQVEAIAVDSNGNVYVAIPQKQLIKKYNSSGKLLLNWGRGGNDSKSFNSPHAITVDSNNNVYVVNCWSNYIQKFDSNGKFISSFNTSAITHDIVGSIAVDKNNNIFLGTTSSILKVDGSGKLLEKYGELGYEDNQFQFILGLAFDKNGNLYAADSKNNRIQILTAK